MADELDEWLSDEQSQGALRSDQVAHREDGKEQAYDEAGEHLHGPVSPPPPGELIVPAGRQQLLAVGLGYKLNGGEEEEESVLVGRPPFTVIDYAFHPRRLA